MNYKKLLVLALLSLPLTSQAIEQNQPQNRVHFSVEVEKQIPYDVMQVKLFLQEEHTDLTALHKNISAKLNQALTKIKAQPAIEIQSNNRSTHIRYNEKGRKNGWVERADLVLESKDFYVLSQLIDEVSDVLSVENIQSMLSPATLANFEDELSKQVLVKFNHKAALIQQSLNAKGYRLISLNMPTISENNNANTEAIMYKDATMMRAMSAEPVQLESGKTTIKAKVNAQIELIEN